MKRTQLKFDRSHLLNILQAAVKKLTQNHTKTYPPKVSVYGAQNISLENEKAKAISLTTKSKC
jgi:hypothetical protein